MFEDEATILLVGALDPLPSLESDLIIPNGHLCRAQFTQFRFNQSLFGRAHVFSSTPPAAVRGIQHRD
jgi:hypothetical protein